MFVVFRSEIYVDTIYISAKLIQVSLVAVWLIRDRPVPGRDRRWNRTIYVLNQNCPVPVRCEQTPSKRRPGTVRCHFTLNDPTKRRKGAVEL